MTRILAGTLALVCAWGLGWAQTPEMLADSQRAKQYLAQGRFGDAIPIYERLVTAMPANPGLRLNLAMALHFAGEDARAIPQFETVVKQQPAALPAWMLLGASYLRTGQPAKAVPPLEKAMAMAPTDGQGRAMLADALLMLERYPAAIPHLKKLAAADAANPRAWYGLGRCYEAIAQKAFEDLEKLGPDSQWWLMLAAEARVKLGRNTAAFALYRAALEKKPVLRGLHAGLAEVYRKTNHADWAAVEEAAEKKLPPLACGVPTAECHFAKGRFELALTAALARRTAEGYFWQVKAANELARKNFEQLAKLPPSVESHQVMAELYRNQGRHADAIRSWQEALKLAPDDLHLQQELVTSVYMNRDYAAAERMARDLLSKDSKIAEAHFILGDSLLSQQLLEPSIEPLKEAVRLNKDYLSARAVLGRALLQLGRAGEALPHLEAAASVDVDGSLHFQLSRAYQEAGDKERAIAAMRVYQKLRKTSTDGDVEISGPSEEAKR